MRADHFLTDGSSRHSQVESLNSSSHRTHRALPEFTRDQSGPRSTLVNSGEATSHNLLFTFAPKVLLQMSRRCESRTGEVAKRGQFIRRIYKKGVWLGFVFNPYMWPKVANGQNSAISRIGAGKNSRMSGIAAGLNPRNWRISATATNCWLDRLF